MKKFNHLNKVLLGSLTVGALLANPLASFAASQADADAVALSCASAIDVMGCIRETQGYGTMQTQSLSDAGNTAKNIATQQATSAITGVANQLFGPVQVGLRYDTDLSWIADLGYSQQIGNFAAALKASIGPNEYRGNATLGYALTKNQQVKVTYEYLRQNLPFEFTSGNINQWVSQQAFGAAYRYVFNNSRLQSAELYGSYAKANSKELGDAYIYDNGGNLDQINQRRIAGGEEKNAGANVTFLPFKNTSIKVGGGYSTLSFDHKDGFASKDGSIVKDTSTIAYNAEINHVLGDKTMLTTSVSNTASARSHTAKISQILPGNLEASLVGQYNFSHTSMPDNGSVTANLSYPAPKSYSANFAAAMGDLKNWVETPVVHYSRVLAVAEERLIAAKMSTSAIPDQSVQVGANISPIETNKYFTYNKDAYNSINYNIVSIVDKADASKHLSAADLGLKVTKENSYDARVESATAMPTNALAGTQSKFYVMTIEAEGIRNGTAISRVDNTVNILVGKSTQSAGQWADDNGVTTLQAYEDLTYTQSIKSNYIVKAGVKDDVYSYTPSTDMPSWLTIDANGNFYSKSPVVGSYTFKLSAKSTATDNIVTTDPHTFTISVANKNAPKWTSDCSIPGKTSTPVGTTISGSIKACVTSPEKITFAIGNNPPSSLGGWNIDDNGTLTGTPNDVSQVDNTIQVPVIASTVDGGPVTGWVKITIQNGNFPAPKGTNRPATPAAITGSSAYNSESLANFFDVKPDLVNDYYTYKLDTTNCDSKGLKLKLSKDTDTADQKVQLILADPQIPVPAPTSCTVNISATSKASKASTSSDSATATITVQQNGIIWTEKSLTALTFVVDPTLESSPDHYANINNVFVRGDGLTLQSVTLAPDQNLDWFSKFIWFTAQSSPTSSPAYMVANTGIPDGTPIGQEKIKYVGTCGDLTLRATASDGSTSDYTFKQICLQPNTALIEPTWKNSGTSGGVYVPALLGQDFPGKSLNPTASSGDTSFVSYTTLPDGTIVADKNTNYRMVANNDSDACMGNLNLTTDGYLTGKITQLPPKNSDGITACTFKFTLDSKARGATTKVIIGKIKVDVPPQPNWNIGNQNRSITLAQGQAGNHFQGIPITTSNSNSTDINLQNNSFDSVDIYVVDPTNDSKSKWAIAKDSANQMFYIYRPASSEVPNCSSPSGKCYDAADIGQLKNVTLRLQLNKTDSKGSVPNVTYQMNVTADPQVTPKIYMDNGPINIEATAGGPRAYVLISDNKSKNYKNQVKTFVDDNMVTNDMITLGSWYFDGQTYSNAQPSNDAATVSSYSPGVGITFIDRNENTVSPNTQYYLRIQGTNINNGWAGNPNTVQGYGNVKFTGVKSVAMGTAVSKDLEYSKADSIVYTTVWGKAELLPTANLPAPKFPTLEVAGGADPSRNLDQVDFINLNPYFKNPVSDLSLIKDFKVICAMAGNSYQDTCGNFRIKQDSTSAHIVRNPQVIGSGNGSVTYYTAIDQYNGPSPFNIPDPSYPAIFLHASYTEVTTVNGVRTTVTKLDNTSCASQVKVTPNTLTMFQPRWDTSLSDQVMKTGDTMVNMTSATRTDLKLGGGYEVGRRVKTCNKGANDFACGNIIIKDDTIFMSNMVDKISNPYVTLTPSATQQDLFDTNTGGGNDRAIYIRKYDEPKRLSNHADSDYNSSLYLQICKPGGAAACDNNNNGAITSNMAGTYNITLYNVTSSAIDKSKYVTIQTSQFLKINQKQ